MRQQRLNVKRRPVGRVRTLFANVARKKKRRQRAAPAAAADFEGDVPNLGVARALVVILLIHVVAIAGIFVHSRWIEGGEEASVAEAEAAEAASVEPATRVIQPPAEEVGELPRIRSGDRLYTVGSGDTYAVIAERFGVDQQALRLANENIPLRPGRYLRIPPKTITAEESPEIAALRGGGEVAPSAPEAPAERVAPVAERAEPEATAERVEPAAPALIRTDAARAIDEGGSAAAAGAGSGSGGYMCVPATPSGRSRRSTGSRSTR